MKYLAVLFILISIISLSQSTQIRGDNDPKTRLSTGNNSCQPNNLITPLISMDGNLFKCNELHDCETGNWTLDTQTHQWKLTCLTCPEEKVLEGKNLYWTLKDGLCQCKVRAKAHPKPSDEACSTEQTNKIKSLQEKKCEECKCKCCHGQNRVISSCVNQCLGVLPPVKPPTPALECGVSCKSGKWDFFRNKYIFVCDKCPKNPDKFHFWEKNGEFCTCKLKEDATLKIPPCESTITESELKCRSCAAKPECKLGGNSVKCLKCLN